MAHLLPLYISAIAGSFSRRSLSLFEIGRTMGMVWLVTPSDGRKRGGYAMGVVLVTSQTMKRCTRNSSNVDVESIA